MQVVKATGLQVKFGGYTVVYLEFKRWKMQMEDKTEAEAKMEKTPRAPYDQSSPCSEQEAKVVTGGEPLDRLTQVTLEADRFATRGLLALFSPILLVFVLRSLMYEKHASWYSWAIGALTSCVYTFGFVLMCPQLYINHQLKSVSHLPWKVRLTLSRVIYVMHTAPF